MWNFGDVNVNRVVSYRKNALGAWNTVAGPWDVVGPNLNVKVVEIGVDVASFVGGQKARPAKEIASRYP